MISETNKLIKTVVIDDEELARKRIKNLLVDHDEFLLVGEAGEAQEALQIIEDKRPDLLFLDISLPGLDGFAIIEAIKDVQLPFVIVVSGSEGHALKAFEYQAFDYLLKPFKDDRFTKAIDLVKAKFYETEPNGKELLLENDALESQRSDEIIPIKHAGKILFIEPNDIQYIEASGYYIEINAHGKKHLLRQSMGRILRRLDAGKFIRIHRSTIINLHFMSEIVRSTHKDHLVKMKDGKMFKVSKSFKKTLFRKLHL